MGLPDFLILSLATWYLSYAFTQTKGPCGVFIRIRTRFPLGGLTTCIYCIAPWLGLAFYGLSQIAAWALLPFAAAGVTAFVFRYTGGSHIE